MSIVDSSDGFMTIPVTHSPEGDWIDVRRIDSISSLYKAWRSFAVGHYGYPPINKSPLEVVLRLPSQSGGTMWAAWSKCINPDILLVVRNLEDAAQVARYTNRLRQSREVEIPLPESVTIKLESAEDLSILLAEYARWGEARKLLLEQTRVMTVKDLTETSATEIRAQFPNLRRVIMDLRGAEPNPVYTRYAMNLLDPEGEIDHLL